jgi:nucleotide-binding universal stress UspA family protein
MVFTLPENEFLRKILVAVDSSQSSETAQELTAYIAKKFNSQVTVMHVVSHQLMNPGIQDLTLGGADVGIPSAGITRGDYTIPTQMPKQPSTSLPTKMISEITSVYREMGEQIVNNAVALFKEEGVSVDKELIEDNNPAQSVTKKAEMETYDLIVLGRSSGEEEKKPHLGSFAAKVARNAKVPVLVGATGSVVRKMLVPIDGSEVSKRVAEHAAKIALKLGTKVTLLHVHEPSLFRMKPELCDVIAKKVFSSVADQVEGVKPEQRCETGHPGKVIPHIAEMEKYDLIVMGSHGHNGVKRLLLGSVADQVLHYANQAVLIVK